MTCESYQASLVSHDFDQGHVLRFLQQATQRKCFVDRDETFPTKLKITNIGILGRFPNHVDLHDVPHKTFLDIDGI